jgi:hypothetical protein
MHRAAHTLSVAAPACLPALIKDLFHAHARLQLLTRPPARMHAGDWTRDETDYLLELCERFDLRFIVIADRYDVGPLPDCQRRLQ